VRYATCSKLEFLGLTLDEALNSAPSLDQDIAALTSRVRILVIRAQEDWAIAENVGRWQRGPLLSAEFLTFPNKKAEHPIALVNHH
jgi:acetate kinase